jgi:hypothetical protein
MTAMLRPTALRDAPHEDEHMSSGGPTTIRFEVVVRDCNGLVLAFGEDMSGRA